MMKKPFLPTIAALCLGLPLSVSSLAQAAESKGKDPFTEKADEPPQIRKQIRVQAEFIDVSHEQLTELMFGAKPAANDTELRQQVAQLVKDGKAKIMETLLCTTPDNQKATTESIEEFIYPTEYEPAEFADDSTGKETAKTEPAKTEPATPGKREALGPTPTAFDTRNLGSTMEIQPTVSEDGKRIDLNFAPEIVYHVGNEIWAEWKEEHGSAHVQMPTMYVLRLTTTVTLANGKPLLVGALTPKNEQGLPDPIHKLMVFVKADILPE